MHLETLKMKTCINKEKVALEQKLNITRKYSVLSVKHSIKKAFPVSLNFKKWRARFWKPSGKCTRVFIHDCTCVSDIVHTMHKNDLFHMQPEFSSVVHILAVIPDHADIFSLVKDYQFS